MLSARAVLRTSLPLLGLGALALQGVLPGSPGPTTLVSQGRGSVAAVDAGRIVTDGHPQVVSLPVRRVAAPAAPAPQAQPAPAERRPTQSSHRVARKARGASAVQVPTPKRVVRDSYPWSADTTQAPDPWGFTKRQCVSYVAWRLSGTGHAIDNATQHWGSALDWDDAATRLGYAVRSRPAIGAVAHWNAGERGSYWSPGASASDGRYVAGPAGHVAWVIDVYDDGSVLVAQYNGTGDRTFSTMRVTAPRYLYL